MGMTPKVNHSRFDFNLMFLTLGIFTTEGTKKKIIIIIIIIIIIDNWYNAISTNMNMPLLGALHKKI